MVRPLRRAGRNRHAKGRRGIHLPTCYVSPVANYAPAGAVSLSLRLNFAAPAPSFIYIGAVAIRVK